MPARLDKAAKASDALLLAVGAAMVVYVTIAVFGLVSSSARHYAAFVLFVMVMSGLASIKVLILERQGKKMIEDGFAEAISGPPPTTPMVLWFRVALASVGTLLAVGGAIYILAHADRLERSAPFFNTLDL